MEVAAVVREPSNWRIRSEIKQAARLAAGALNVQENEVVERIMLLGLTALREQEPKVRAVLEALELP